MPAPSNNDVYIGFLLCPFPHGFPVVLNDGEGDGGGGGKALEGGRNESQEAILCRMEAT